MQFMLIQRQGDAAPETADSPADQRAMQNYLQDMRTAGLGCSGARLCDSGKGIRIDFRGSEPKLQHGPFADEAGLVGAFLMIDAESREQALEWAQRWPRTDGSAALELELRDAGCPGGLSGISPENENPDQRGSKHYMVILKANALAETGHISDDTTLGRMGARNEEGRRSGILASAQGLQPSNKASRLKLAPGRAVIMDGPFSETKELIAGYWIVQTQSQQEALDWALSYPYPYGKDTDLEVREVAALL
jgi:hypothetical protein